VYEINRRGAEIAQAAAKGRALVAGSVGPLGIALEPLSAVSYDEAKDAFKEQVRGLFDGGVDLFVLETFGLAKELEQAIRAVKEVAPDAPVIAEFTVNDEGTLISGSTLESAVKEIAPYQLDAIGLKLLDRAAVDARGAGAPEDADALPISVDAECRRAPERGRALHLHEPRPEYIASTRSGSSRPGRRLWAGAAAPTRAHPGDPAGRAGAAAGAADGRARGDLALHAPEAVKVYDRTEKSRLATKLVRREFVTPRGTRVAARRVARPGGRERAPGCTTSASTRSTSPTAARVGPDVGAGDGRAHPARRRHRGRPALRLP